jgi:hypothetical protein
MNNGTNSSNQRDAGKMATQEWVRPTSENVDTTQQRQILSSIAIMSNRLAHESSGELRAWALRTKVDAVGELIVRGWATANCRRANRTVGITIDGKPRLHVPLNLLEPGARACVREETRSIRATAPLREYLDFKDIEALSVANPK